LIRKDLLSRRYLTNGEFPSSIKMVKGSRGIERQWTMKVCMFVHNNCKNDARVLKEAKTLTEAGYAVRVIALLDKTTEPHEEGDGFRIIRTP
jgi:hypothetical protein